MFGSRLIAQRTIALLLPVCFAWLFVACVSLCAMDNAGAHGADPSHSVPTLDSACDDGCCPLTSAPDTTLPERETTPPAPGAAATTSLKTPAFPAPLPYGPVLAPPPSALDPPLKRLCTLRI